MDSTELRKAGLKATAPRIRILQMLETSAARHLSAEDVYRALLESGEDVGLATIYRVLTQFEAAGLVTRHNFEGGHSVFEINHGQHHDHIVCIRCGHIEEFYDELIEQRQREVLSQAGYSLADHSLILYGDCQRQECPRRKEAGAVLRR